MESIISKYFWSNRWSWNYYKPPTLRECVADFEQGDYLEWMESVGAQSYKEYNAAPATRAWFGGFKSWLTAWLYRVRYTCKPCRHQRMQDHSYGGPDSGYESGECPDCGFSYHVTIY